MLLFSPGADVLGRERWPWGPCSGAGEMARGPMFWGGSDGPGAHVLGRERWPGGPCSGAGEMAQGPMFWGGRDGPGAHVLGLEGAQPSAGVSLSPASTHRPNYPPACCTLTSAFAVPAVPLLLVTLTNQITPRFTRSLVVQLPICHPNTSHWTATCCIYFTTSCTLPYLKSLLCR